MQCIFVAFGPIVSNLKLATSYIKSALHYGREFTKLIDMIATTHNTSSNRLIDLNLFVWIYDVLPS